jgi:hypothetical protein
MCALCILDEGLDGTERREERGRDAGRQRFFYSKGRPPRRRFFLFFLPVQWG